MLQLKAMTQRNIKLFFKDKGLFLGSLITPIILLFLYVAFLGNAFKENFMSFFPPDFSLTVRDKLASSFVLSQVLACILSVCTVTVAFNSNTLQVQDKVKGALRDISITPMKSGVLPLSYFISCSVTTFLICAFSFAAYILLALQKGFYMSATDIAYVFLDTALMTLFGSAVSGIAYFFATTNAQIAAISTIVGAGYGFVCGAYMPTAVFSKGLQKVIKFLPGTYGTALIKRHAFEGIFREIEKNGIPKSAVTKLKHFLDCSPEIGGKAVSQGTMYLIVLSFTAALILIYVLLNVFRARSNAIRSGENPAGKKKGKI